MLNREKLLGKIVSYADELNERNQKGIEKYRKGTFTLNFSEEGKKK